jgi:hypothetical protein
MTKRLPLQQSRYLCAILLAAVTLSGCGSDDSSSDSKTSSSPGTSGSAHVSDRPQAVGDRFEAAVSDALTDHGLADAPGADNVQGGSRILGTGEEPKPWKAHAFPAGGIRADRQIVTVNLPGRANDKLHVVLYELEVPASASACEAPWYYVPPEKPCVVEGLSDSTRLVTAEWVNYREMDVIAPTWVIGTSTYTLGKGRSTIGKTPPLTRQKQRAILLAVAEGIAAGSGTAGNAEATRTYTAPGTPVSLTLPATWDASDGAIRGTINVRDTKVDRGLFLEPDSKPFVSSGNFPCRVLSTEKVDATGVATGQLRIRATVTDSRALVGKVGFEAFITDDTGPIPCDAIRGVGFRGKTATLRDSLQFDTIADAEAYVESADYAAVVAVMKTFTVK